MKAAVQTCNVYGYLACPVGELLVAGDADHVRLISFPTGKTAQRHLPEWRRDDAHFADTFQQLSAYFAKELTTFDFPMRFEGTPFQNAVWRALLNIPFGETASYGDIAKAIGQPKAGQAVGAANGANPLPIVIPCHRVIGSTGKMTGFGGGIETKEFLLAHERGPDAQLGFW